MKKRKLGRKLLAFLLSLALVAGIIPGMSMTALAWEGDPYASLLNTTTVVKFDNKDWYLIENNSTAANDGTVTLLSKECVEKSAYNSSGSFVAYDNNPTIKGVVDKWYSDNITSDAKTAVNGNKMFLLTNEEAKAITNAEVRKCTNAFNNGWWLCSQGSYGAACAAWVNGGSGDVNEGGYDVKNSIIGVRPALKLKLSEVKFDPTTGTFSTHEHNFTYQRGTGANANKIIATCDAVGCTLPAGSAGEGDHVATLTIVAPTLTTYGQTGNGISAEAVITDTDGIKGDATVKYYKATKSDSNYTKTGEALASAPTYAGDYVAEITLGIAPNAATAGVGYTIARARESAPVADTTNLSVDYTSETISANPGFEVAADDNGAEITDFPSILDNASPTVYIRTTASDANHDPSAWVGVTLSSRPPAPTGLGSTNAKNDNTANGTITGTDNTMQYKNEAVGGELANWTAIGGNTVTELKPGTYLVRIAATSATPHGVAAEVTVGSDYVELNDSNKPTISLPDSHTTPAIGDTLTIDTTAMPITYQWYVDEEPVSGETGGTYTVKTEDYGKAIYVEVTQSTDSEGYSLDTPIKKQSEATAAVVKKAGPAAPTTIEATKTATGLTITAPAQSGEGTEASPYKYEYSIDGTNWQKEANFDNLLPGRSYTVSVRERETGDTQAGSTKTSTVVTDLTVTISGAASEKCTLTANVTGSANNYSYTWHRGVEADFAPGNGNAISGANQKTYKLTDDDIGKYIKVVARQTNPEASGTSASTASVATHTHNFTYSLSGDDTIWAHCDKNDCWIDYGEITHGMATLSIAAPEHETFGDGKSAVADITDVNVIRNGAEVRYYETDSAGTNRSGEALSQAPVNPGTYWAEITLGEGDGAKTAHVIYTINKAANTGVISQDTLAQSITKTGDSISIESTDSGYEYAVVPKGTAYDWTTPAPVTGNGNTLTFGNLNPGTEYDVRARAKENDTTLSGTPTKITVMTNVSVAIDSTPIQGKEVRVTLTPNVSGATFKWYIGSSITPDGTGTKVVPTTGGAVLKVEAYAGDPEALIGTATTSDNVKTLARFISESTSSPVTVVLDGPIKGGITMPEKEVIFDLKGQKVEGYIIVPSGSKLTIIDSSSPQTGTVKDGVRANTGDVIIKGGKYDNKPEVTNPGTVTIHGGMFQGDPTSILKVPYAVRESGVAPYGYEVYSTYEPLTNANKPAITITKAEGNTDTNIPQIGDTLTATTTANPVTYQWYRGGVAIENASGSTYTLTGDDLGKVMTVKATQTANVDGEGNPSTDQTQTSDPTDDVERKTNSKAQINAATLSNNIEKTGESITIKLTDSDYEYAVVAKGTVYDWTTPTPQAGNGGSLTFDGLSAGTDYDVYVRAKETSDSKPGEETKITMVTNVNVTIAGPLVQGKQVSVTLNPSVSGVTFKWYIGGSTTPDGEGTEVVPTAGGGVLKVDVYAGTPAELIGSAETTNIVKSKRTETISATDITVTPETGKDVQDGTITISYYDTVNKPVEYSTDEGKNWTPVPDGTTGTAGKIEGLSVGTVQLRYKETDYYDTGTTLGVRIGGTNALTGITITRDTICGQTLSVALIPGGTAGVSYQWSRKSGNGPVTVITGAEGAAYTLTAADVDKIIQVTVTDNWGNKFTKNTTTAVTKIIIPAPTGLTQNKVTPNENNGEIGGLDSGTRYQYSSDNGENWTNVPAGETAITGLAAGTYLIRVNPVDETTTQAVPAKIILSTYELYQLPPTELKPIYATSGGATDGGIRGVATSMEYSLDTDNWDASTATWISINSVTIETGMADKLTGLTGSEQGKLYHVRYKEVKNGETVIKTASKPVDIIIKVKENQSVPTGIAVTGESAIDANDGKISGVNDTMEYRKKTGGSFPDEWTPVPEGETEIDGLSKDTSVEIRYKGTDTKKPGDTYNIPAVGYINPLMAARGKDYRGVYDGKEHSISITNIPENATVTYAEAVNGDYSETAPKMTNAGTKTVYWKISEAGYTDVTGINTITIVPKNLIASADDQTITVGKTIRNNAITYTGAVQGETISVTGGTVEVYGNGTLVADVSSLGEGVYTLMVKADTPGNIASVKDASGNEIANGASNYSISAETIRGSLTILPAPAVGKIKVTRSNGDGITEETEIDKGEKITRPTDPQKTGYTFDNWVFVNTNGVETFWNFDNTIEDNLGNAANEATFLTLYPKWTLVSYTIKLNPAGGRLSADGSDSNTFTDYATYNIETAISLPQPVRDGYTFTGWTGSGLSEPTIEAKIPAGSTGDRSYTATWSENQNNGVREGEATMTVIATDTAISAETPLTEDAIDGIKEADAQSQAAAASVKVNDLSTGTVDGETQRANEVNVTVTAEAVPYTGTQEQREIKNDAAESFGAGVTENNIATDFIEATVHEVQSYVESTDNGKEKRSEISNKTISNTQSAYGRVMALKPFIYKLPGGQHSPVISRYHGNSVTRFRQLAHKPINGIYTDATVYLEKLSEDEIIVYIYSSRFSTFGISTLNAETEVQSITINGIIYNATNGTTIPEPTPRPTKEGYDFDHWEDQNKEEVTFPLTIGTDTQDITTIDPVFKEKTGGGGGGGTTTYTPVITKPEHGTITVNPASPQSGQNAVVTVTPEDGYETEDITVKDKDGNTVPVTKNDDGTYTFTQPVTGPVTIEAVVKQATDLTPVIKKPDHGAISVNPAKPKAGEPAIITITPDEGYEVDSVILTDKDGKPVAFTLNEDGTYSFVQPESGCVTIEAVLRLKDGVIVRFDLNGKTGTEPDPQTFIKGGKAVRPNDPAAEGYTFTGWFTDKECKNAYDFDTPVNEDIILYAGWEKKAGPGPEDEDFGIYFAELFDDPYEGVHYNADYNDGEGRYEIVYTGAPIKPLIKVTSKADGVLKEGIDYSVSYSNNKNYSKKKPATIKVSGKGFYKSKKVLELYILQADLEEAQTRGLIAGADELKTLSGKKLNPVIVYRGYKLKSSDLNLSNKDKITADTTTDITGKGNFTGTLKDVEVKVIGKDDQKKGAIKVNLKAGKHVYNGEAHELSITTADTAGELTVTAGSSKTPLEEGTDFVVSYSGNTDAGKAAVAITGIGEYNGTVVRNFTIEADKTTDITPELAEPDEPVYFNVRGAKPDITVTAHRKAEDETVSDEVLTEGKDYKVSYSSNMKIGDGSYTVKFLGNYKGHKDAKGSFKIVQAPIEEAKVEAVQMIYKKPGKYLPKPFVSIDGVQLKNSDYTYKYYIDEEEITSKYKLSLADDETSKTVKIVVTGKGNYTDTTAEGTYEVVRRTANAIDLTKAKIVAKDKVKGKDVSVAKQEYNGYAIEPEIRVMAKVNKKWVDVDPDDYTVSYINNVNKGTGTILITGDGEKAIGSKTARFSINTMRFELFKLIFGK